MNRVTIVGLVLALVAPLLASAAAPASAATPAATSCKTIGRFTGSKAHMKHWLSCKHVPFDVVQGSGTSPTITSYDADGRVIKQATASPDAGGPSCQWLATVTDDFGAKHATMKACYGHGVLHLVCSKWYADLQEYPYHCGPLDLYNKYHATKLWSWIKHNFPKIAKAARACARGTIPGIVAGVIIAVAGGGLIGLVAGTAGGCVGGIVNYYWK